MNSSLDLWVELTVAELDAAKDHGRLIYLDSRKRNHHDYTLGDKSGIDSLGVSVMGAIGECAAGKGLGLIWPKHINNYKEPDLPHNIEVRSRNLEHYKLRIKRNDVPSRRVVDVIVPADFSDRRFRIVGWLNAKHGQREIFWEDPNDYGYPCFFVPHFVTHPIGLLFDLIERDHREDPFTRCLSHIHRLAPCYPATRSARDAPSARR